MVLSADPNGDPAPLAIVGAAAALAISDIPFHYVLAGVRVGSVNGKLIAIHLTKRPGTRGSTSSSRAPKKVSSWWRPGPPEPLKPRWSRPSISATSAAARSPPAFASYRPWPASRSGHSPAPVNEELLAAIDKEFRAELSDALNTGKYPKLESHHRVGDLKKRVVEKFCGRTTLKSRRPSSCSKCSRSGFFATKC